MEQVKLTASEWNVMNCLWESSPQTVMQLSGTLERTMGWHRSTTITTLHRMESKGLIRCEPAEEGKRGKAYVPLAQIVLYIVVALQHRYILSLLTLA